MMQLLCFDKRRGNAEGTEADKLLGYHPAQTSPDQQCGLAGLLQGLLLFSSNFRPAACWDEVETDKATWVVHEAEPNIWFAVTAPKLWLPRHSTSDGLRATLVQAHHAVTLLAGRVEQLLGRDPSGGLARGAVQPVLEFVAAQLGSTTTWHHRELRNPLMDAALVPTLGLSQLAALAVQSYCNRLLQAAPGAAPPVVQDVMVLHQRDLLWSSLQPGDTARAYCVLAGSLLYPSAPIPKGSGEQGRSVASALESSAWQQRPDGFIMLRAAGDGSSGGDVPVVHLGSQSHHRMLPMLEGKLLTVLFLAPGVTLEPGVTVALLGAASMPAKRLATQIGEEIKSSGLEPGHLPGFRFLLRDGNSHAVQATPRSKVSAMTHHSRSLAATLRDSLAWKQQPEQEQLEAAAAEGGADGDAEACQPSAAAVREVLVKSSQGFWALLQRRGAQQLLAVRERRIEQSSAEASACLEGFADLLFVGSI